MWNLKGEYIEATYLGDYKVTGKVLNSRVKYGGGVQHHIKLVKPITIYGTERESMLIDHKDVQRVFSNI